MSKHTPGPWSSQDREKQVFVPLRSVDCERIGFSIGFVSGHRQQEAAANARLIAAAPELLEALRTLLSYAFTLEMRLLDADGEHRAMQKARAAIAAVEGEKT